MEGAFRDLHFGIMSTFVNVKIVRFAVIVNKDRNITLTLPDIGINKTRTQTIHPVC